MTEKLNVEGIIEELRGESLSRIFIVGTRENGDLYAAGSGTEDEALQDVAEFLSALAKGKFK